MGKMGIKYGPMHHISYVSFLNKRENYFDKYRSDGDSHIFSK